MLPSPISSSRRNVVAGLVMANVGLASAFTSAPLPMGTARASHRGAAASRQPLRMVATPPLQPPGSMEDPSVWKGTESPERELVRGLELPHLPVSGQSGLAVLLAKCVDIPAAAMSVRSSAGLRQW